MSAPLRIALAGLGTVGIGVIRLLQANRDLVTTRAGRPLEIVSVSARDRTLDRGVDLSPYAWEEDMTAMAARDDVDVVVELVGGSDGPALTLARNAIAANKHFVTANKAMIAHHGLALAHASEAHGTALKFEAAVAGGIPVVKGLREGAAANAIEQIYGILNGTANYILSTMEASGADFATTLKDAQALGYAEADPTFDIEGVDAAHKLSILAAISFGAKVDFDAVACEGISRVRAADIAQADVLGYVIRLIGWADVAEIESGAPALLQQVKPCLVPKGHPLAHVTGATNAVVAEGNFSGRLLFQGAGAGDGPTASAVVADLIDIARGEAGNPFSVPTSELIAMEPAESGERTGQTYLRFTVTDRPGVLAEITAAMRDANVSIESLIQQGRANDGGEVLVAMVTHDGPERCVDAAVALLSGSASLTAPPLVMKILEE
ncbi:homoserine dehydrogenase [Pontixanthobacter aestiaquae]|uniref:Homoserine dehydrogenase n=1 Tax=Pontixanthobacter aestiaquae TaxID=1509367 RepID=A0A844Z579_9SPHN|nr:homoserine dehydrogenase [Pontixanthobacter aestiaquae]MDN3647042.1 homoserine dehydrogenase [Pontixanthobacter aestiaquae]MXO81980.1 homoserine dehydrogenase [Pontixanthobacter aestiaquae]